MAKQAKKRSPWIKGTLIGILILLFISAGVYWYLANEKFSDTGKKKSAYTINAPELIKEFQKNDNAANKRYADKIITVNGTVSEIETADTTVNIKFIDTATGSYIIFAFQEQHLAEAKSVKVGDNISVKGSCSGGIYSEILGTEAITFKRCTVNKNK